MFSMCAASTAADCAAPEPLGDDQRWELDTLKALGDLGLRLARTTVAEAETRAEAPDPALAFSRVSRAVRLTVMLHARIREGDPGKAADAAERARQAQAELEDRRLTGRLRRSMTQFIVQTAVEALDREAPETERLFDALDERLGREGEDDADFAEIEVKEAAYAIAQDLGVDPGPDWWLQGWGIISPPTLRSSGGGGPPNGGGGGRPMAAFTSGAASSTSPQMFRSG
jgi:hypothetical protein